MLYFFHKNLVLPYLLGLVIFCLLHCCHLLDNSYKYQYVKLKNKENEQWHVDVVSLNHRGRHSDDNDDRW